jgi:hypothetical protein
MLVIDALTTLRNAMYAVVDIDSLRLRGHVPDLVCGKLAVCHSTLQRCCLVHHVRILYQFCICDQFEPFFVVDANSSVFSGV